VTVERLGLAEVVRRTAAFLSPLPPANAALAADGRPADAWSQD